MVELRKFLIGGAIGTSVLALSAVSASAAVVCSGNVCWHTHETYTYPPGARVIVHPDNWSWGPSEHFSWREHEGRGYWNGDNWTEFEDHRRD
jgi:hypothetical protein